jgi:hypothetical protein
MPIRRHERRWGVSFLRAALAIIVTDARKPWVFAVF